MANSGAPATEILEKRIALFERIQAMQRDEILAKGGEPIKYVFNLPPTALPSSFPFFLLCALIRGTLELIFRWGGR
jgi:hypothetical protein